MAKKRKVINREQAIKRLVDAREKAILRAGREPDLNLLLMMEHELQRLNRSQLENEIRLSLGQDVTVDGSWQPDFPLS